MEELHSKLIATLILLLAFWIIQISSCAHEAVYLVIEGLNVLGDFQLLIILLDVISRLFLRSEHHHGDLDVLGVRCINHSRAGLDSCLEFCVLARNQGGHLATPAVANDTPRLDVAVGLLSSIDQTRNLWQMLRWCSTLEPFAELGLLIIVCWWIPRDVCWVAVEEIWDKDLVWMVFIAMGNDIRALECLRKETEDIVN